MRARHAVAQLRAERVFTVVREAIRRGQRETFRIVHYSVQHDHLHLVVEASDRERLRSGVQGLATRIARSVNRVLGQRRGRFWADRYHRRDLRTPREVRNALVYVLMNHRKHVLVAARRDAGGGLVARVSLATAIAFARLDPCSSAGWFDGWATRAGPPAPNERDALGRDPQSARRGHHDLRRAGAVHERPPGAVQRGLHDATEDPSQAEQAFAWVDAPVVPARSWLARAGWRLHGLLDPRESPVAH